MKKLLGIVVLGLLFGFNVNAEVLGCIKGNCINEGTYVYNNGSKYSGQFKNSKRHGKGIGIFPNGNTYEGEWYDGLPNGKGIYTWAPGTGGAWKKYEGNFVGLKKHGVGILTYRDGKSFNVVFNNDNLEEKKNLIIAKQKKSEKFDLRDGPGRCIGYIISKLGYEGESSITNGNINYYKKNKDEYNLLIELELRVKNKNLCAAGQPLRQCLIDFSEYEKELYIEFATGKKIYHKVKNKPAERSLTELGCSDFDYLKD